MTTQNQITFNSTAEIKPLLRKIQQMVFARIKGSPDISPLLLLLVGVLNRTYELTDSAIWSIENKRPLTSAHMLRGLIETLGFIYYWEKQIEAAKDIKIAEEKISQALFGTRRAGNSYQQVNTLTAIDSATTEFSELRKTYDDVSEAVHPNSASHFYYGKAVDDEEKLAEFRLPFYDFKGTDEKATINQTGECCYHIIQICKRLLTKS